MPDEHNGMKSRRTVLKTVGTLGVTGLGAASTLGQAGATEDSTIESNNEYNHDSSIPGVSHQFTVSADFICYAAGGLCLIAPTPAGTIAAKGCVVAGASCFLYETLQYLGWDGCDISVYSLPFFMPKPYIAVPECIPDPISLIEDLIDEYAWTPWSDIEYEQQNVNHDEWAISKEFAREYDLGPEFNEVPRFEVTA